ncbi:unnamed protein product, partial [Ascophyllum nodosum]
SYACTDVIGNVIEVNRVNYFSNPNVTFQGRPTGTVTNNCARRILETKDVIASYRDPNPVPTPPPTLTGPTPAPPVVAPTPPPTLPGPTPVPTLPGPTPAPPVVAPTPSSVVAPTPPPVPTPTPPPVTTPTPVPTRAPDTCSNGVVGVERGTICCALGCGTCGGSGCAGRGRDQ